MQTDRLLSGSISGNADIVNSLYFLRETSYAIFNCTPLDRSTCHLVAAYLKYCNNYNFDARVLHSDRGHVGRYTFLEKLGENLTHPAPSVVYRALLPNLDDQEPREVAVKILDTTGLRLKLDWHSLLSHQREISPAAQVLAGGSLEAARESLIYSGYALPRLSTFPMYGFLHNHSEEVWIVTPMLRGRSLRFLMDHPIRPITTEPSSGIPQTDRPRPSRRLSSSHSAGGSPSQSPVHRNRGLRNRAFSTASKTLFPDLISEAEEKEGTAMDDALDALLRPSLSGNGSQSLSPAPSDLSPLSTSQRSGPSRYPSSTLSSGSSASSRTSPDRIPSAAMLSSAPSSSPSSPSMHHSSQRHGSSHSGDGFGFERSTSNRKMYPTGIEDEAVLATILLEVLKALTYFKAQGMVHGGIKAANILLAGNGQILLSEGDLHSRLLVGSGKTLGGQFDSGLERCLWRPPEWLDPESYAEHWSVIPGRINTYHNMDHRFTAEESLHLFSSQFMFPPHQWTLDVWSFGIAALELAFGRVPYQQLEPIRAIYYLMRKEPPGVHSYILRPKPDPATSPPPPARTRTETCGMGTDWDTPVPEEPAETEEGAREQTISYRAEMPSDLFRSMLELCLQKDPAKRATPEAISHHPFFAQAQQPSAAFLQERLVPPEIPIGPVERSRMALSRASQRRNSNPSYPYSTPQQNTPATGGSCSPWRKNVRRIFRNTPSADSPLSSSVLNGPLHQIPPVHGAYPPASQSPNPSPLSESKLQLSFSLSAPTHTRSDPRNSSNSSSSDMRGSSSPAGSDTTASELLHHHRPPPRPPFPELPEAKWKSTSNLYFVNLPHETTQRLRLAQLYALRHSGLRAKFLLRDCATREAILFNLLRQYQQEMQRKAIHARSLSLDGTAIGPDHRHKDRSLRMAPSGDEKSAPASPATLWVEGRGGEAQTGGTVNDSRPPSSPNPPTAATAAAAGTEGSVPVVRTRKKSSAGSDYSSSRRGSVMTSGHQKSSSRKKRRQHHEACGLLFDAEILRTGYAQVCVPREQKINDETRHRRSMRTRSTAAAAAAAVQSQKHHHQQQQQRSHRNRAESFQGGGGSFTPMIRSQQVEDLFFGEVFSLDGASNDNSTVGMEGGRDVQKKTAAAGSTASVSQHLLDASEFDPIMSSLTSDHAQFGAAAGHGPATASATPDLLSTPPQPKKRSLLVDRPPPMSPVGEIDSSHGSGDAFDVFAGLVPHPGVPSLSPELLFGPPAVSVGPVSGRDGGNSERQASFAASTDPPAAEGQQQSDQQTAVVNSPLGILGLLLTPSLESTAAAPPSDGQDGANQPTEGGAAAVDMSPLQPLQDPRHQQQLSDALDQLQLPIPFPLSEPFLSSSAAPETPQHTSAVRGGLAGEGEYPSTPLMVTATQATPEAQMLPGSTVDLLLDAASHLTAATSALPVMASSSGGSHSASPASSSAGSSSTASSADASSSVSSVPSSADTVAERQIQTAAEPLPPPQYQASSVIDILSLERELVKEVIGP